MKHNKLTFVLCVLAATVLTGCSGDDESKQHYDNKLFISAGSFVDEVRIDENVDKISREITLGVAKPENHDIAVSFRVAPELVGTYREAYYDPDVTLLPETHYDLSQVRATLKAGKIASDPIGFEFVKLDQLDLDKRYVLPVTMGSVTGVDVLQGAKTVYYVFKEASLVNVVADINQNCAWPDWENFDEVEDMTAFTMEALVYGHAFLNNIATVMGIEDKFLIRIGDDGIPRNQLQVAYALSQEGTIKRGDVTSASLKLQPGRWYHIAVTFDNGLIKVYIDGKEKASGDAGSLLKISSINFKVPHSDESNNQPRCFWIGYSYDKERYLNGMISEARVWNKALTEEEIQAENHFYKVDPDSEGLVAYWKLDEGNGKTARDYTSYGNDLAFESAPKWVAVELPAKE